MPVSSGIDARLAERHAGRGCQRSVRMKILAAPNALKGSLSAFEAAAAIGKGARRALPTAEVVELAIADGGDGTAEVLARGRGGSFRELVVQDALGRPCAARYAWLPEGTAVVDVATASGLAQLREEEKRPLTATSYGTGELVRKALENGATRVLLGVGGSATVDGGAGILQALGVRLLDEQGRELERGGAALARLARIDVSGVTAQARELTFEVACDVDSPLLGPYGAAAAFGPQKGASPAEARQLEAALTHYASIIARDFARDVAHLPAGGAAGGIAAGLHGVLGARLLPGVDLVLDVLGFEQALAGAALCITAEGALDAQSLRNKGPVGVARRAKARGVPAVVLAGSIEGDLVDTEFPDVAAMFSICSRPSSLEQAMREASPLLSKAAERVVRLFSLARELAPTR